MPKAVHILTLMALSLLFLGGCLMPHGRATLNGGDGGLHLGGDVGVQFGAGDGGAGGGGGDAGGPGGGGR